MKRDINDFRRTLAKFDMVLACDVLPKRLRRTWGEWTLCKHKVTLSLDREGYSVDLGQCNSSAEILDWILQIKTKDWSTPQVLADFLTAVVDILHPQQNYCSGGKSTEKSSKHLADDYFARMENQSLEN